MIIIDKNPTADTRTCDWSKVTKKQLLDSSIQHIEDVKTGLELFSKILVDIATRHDYDKITDIVQFHEDFKTGFKQTTWWDNHRKLSRHHINMPDGVPEDVNLLDVLEHIVDCVMAGMARSGQVYKLDLSDELLQGAFQNTVEYLKSQVEVVD